MSDRPLPAPRTAAAPPASIERELESAARYAASALAPATRRAYERDWCVFADWCVARGLRPMPAAPEAVAAFLAAEADREFRPVTIAKRAAAHRAQDEPNPCDSAAVAAVVAGIRRERGVRPLRKAHPLELEPLARLLEPIDTATLAGVRDRAMLLLGFAAALRRSELVALDVDDLAFDPARGLLVTIRRSKADQEQEGGRSRSPTPKSPTAARSGRYAATSTLQASTAAPCSGSCAAATTSQTSGSQTNQSRSSSNDAPAPPASPPSCSPSTRYAPDTPPQPQPQPQPQPPASRSARSPTSPHRNLPVLRGYIRAATAFDDVGKVL
jgi:hypothetical protein